MRPRSANTLFYPRTKPKYSDKDKSRFKNARIAPLEKNNDPSSVTYRTERSKDIMTMPNPLIQDPRAQKLGLWRKTFTGAKKVSIFDTWIKQK